MANSNFSRLTGVLGALALLGLSQLPGLPLRADVPDWLGHRPKAPPVPAPPAPFEIPPYLFAAGAGHLQLGWEYIAATPPPSPPQVRMFAPDGRVSAPIPAHADGPLWLADLPLPNCGFGQVAYQVSGMAQPQVIAPIPCPGDTTTSARFSFIADAQEGPQFVWTIAREIAQFPGSAVISGGDLVQTGSDLDAWRNYFWAMSPVGGQRVTLPAIGNHEYRSTPETNFWGHFFQTPPQAAHYSFFLGSAHIIVLNSCFEDDASQIEGQLPWLTHELGVPARWKIVVFHHPPFSRSVMNAESYPRKEYLHVQQRYVPIFEALGVDVVLNGHTHIYERSVRNRIQYVITGAAGGRMGYVGSHNPFELVTERSRTVVHLEVTPTVLDAVALDPTGRRVDSFRLTKE